jgi:pyrroline-5-carboxylate reductase
MKIGILGLGKMGDALVQGMMASQDGFKISATTRSTESAEKSSHTLKINVHTHNVQLVSESEVIILCVKPSQAEKVLKEIAPHLKARHLLISVCAGVETSQMEVWIKNACPVIRSMPNTPAVIREAMTVLCLGAQATSTHLQIAKKIFSSIGKTALLEESLMDGATGLSGCGPAYCYLIIEALSEAGVKVGLPREQSTLLAAQTMMGAAKMVLDRGVHPAELKDEVTTPAGCTIDGLMALEEGKIRVALVKAVVAAKKRSQKLRGN